MGVLSYSANNSGGGWWLGDKQWKALEKAGWVVHWIHDKDDPSHNHAKEEIWAGEHTHEYSTTHQLTKVKWNGDRWLGAAARSAAIKTDDPEVTILEWENVTGEDAGAIGCNCCGRPHGFTHEEDGETRYFEVDEPRVGSWSI